MNGGASVPGGAAGERTAFRLWPVHEHRASGSVISALALSADGGRLYVGLSDGQLEEHRIVASASGAYLSLTARKHISKKVWMQLVTRPGSRASAPVFQRGCNPRMTFNDI